MINRDVAWVANVHDFDVHFTLGENHLDLPRRLSRRRQMSVGMRRLCMLDRGLLAAGTNIGTDLAASASADASPALSEINIILFIFIVLS